MERTQPDTELHTCSFAAYAGWTDRMSPCRLLARRTATVAAAVPATVVCMCLQQSFVLYCIEVDKRSKGNYVGNLSEEYVVKRQIAFVQYR